MFKVGQTIYGIEVIDDNFDSAEIKEYIFMAESEDYIICCNEENLKNKLYDMYKKSIKDNGIFVNLLQSEYVFETYNQANDYLVEMIYYN